MRMEEPAVRQPRLLIVTEDPLLRAMLTEWSVGAGFKADIAQDSEVAAELCDMDTYQAVVVDFDMTPVKAFETVLFLRAQGRDGTTIALVNSPSDRLNALICGASAVLSKPVCLEDLETLIETCQRRDASRPVFTLVNRALRKTDAAGAEVSPVVPLRMMGGSR